MKLRYDILLDPIVMISTLLLIIIPVTVQYVNRYLHKYGDPPWKENSDENMDDEHHREKQQISK